MKSVFILGPARTGSKIYMNILNEHTSIDIMPELHFLSPFWIRKDFVSTVKKSVGDLNLDANIPKLINLLYSKQLNGSFWNSIDLDKNRLQKAIISSDKSFKSLFEILLKEHADYNNKLIPGAKFPVHFSYISTLLEWFPQCKIIFLIRDPRAIFCSNVRKYLKTSHFSFINILTVIKILIYSIHQFKSAVRIHKKYEHLHNYELFKFEDVIIDSEKYIKKLCRFLDVEFKSEMLLPHVVDSSYHSEKKRGFDRQTLTRWKGDISSFSKILIESTTFREMKELKYL
jgi:hypothetical protein